MTYADRSERIKQMQAIKRQEDDEQFNSITFKPERPGLKSKGMRDSREMFTNPKGTEQALKRAQEGRQLREELRKIQLRPHVP